MKKLLVAITSIIIIIFSNTITTLATVSSFKEINIHRRQTTPEPQPGPSWQNDDLLHLDNVIQKKDLGIISDYSPITILARLQELNPNLNVNNIYISNITYNSAIIRSLSSTEYSGSTMVFFTSQKVTDLSSAIVNTKLDTILNFTQEGILQRIKELNPEIDASQIYVDHITQNDAMVKPLPTSILYRGYKNVQFNRIGIIEFSKLKINKILGIISDYSPTTILTRLHELNPNINISELYVENITATTCKIKVLPNSRIYKKTDFIYVYFNMPFLSSFIMNWNLGEIENNDENTILAYLLIYNPGIDTSQLRVSNVTENSAVISAIPNSPQYQGHIFITFFVQKRRFFLHEIISSSILILPDFEVDTILQNLRELNPGIDTSQLVVKKYGNKKKVRIKAKENSKIYRGEVIIDFAYSTSSSLASIVANSNLNTIPNNNVGTILHYFQRNNPNVNINQVYIEEVTENSAVITASPRSSIYHGQVVINFNLWILNDIIVNRDLGEISENSPTAILTRLHELNPFVNTSRLSVQNITENSAEISDETFPLHFQRAGTITVNFKALKKVTILKNIIVSTMLGYLQINSEEFLLNRLEELNPNLDISQVYIANFTENTAIIRARPDSNILTGEVIVYFTLNKVLTNVGNVIVSNYLGQIENLLLQTIIRHLILLNPEIDINQIYITNITENSAVISARSSSDIYIGSRTVYFNINLEMHDLESIIPYESSNLGPIPDFRPETILNRLQELNPNIDVNQLFVQNISNTSAEIFSQPDSNDYTGQTTVYFYFEPIHYLLANVIMNPNLGEISENSPTAILTRLHELNPNINISELSVQNITENSAEIIPIENSLLYTGQVTVNFNLGLRRDLDSELVNTYLGDFSEINFVTIFNTISELNPNIDINQIDITNITENSAIISPSLFSIYKNEVEVKFETTNNIIKSDYSDKFEKVNDTILETENLNLILSKKTFRKITFAFFKKKQEDAIDEIKNILKISLKEEKNEKDLAILAILIWNHFSYYKELYDTLSENQSVLIKTNSAEYWDETDPTNHNKILGKDKGYRNQNFLTKTSNQIATYSEKNDDSCLKEFPDSYNILEGYYSIYWFKLRIKLATLLYIKALFYISDKTTFINKLSQLLYSFLQTSDSNFKSYDTAKSDIHHTAYMIWEHFSYYQNLIYYMNKGQALIITNKSGMVHGYWDDSEPWKYNEVVGQKISVPKIKNNNDELRFNDELKINKRSFYVNHQNKIYSLYPSLLKLKQKISDKCN